MACSRSHAAEVRRVQARLVHTEKAIDLDTVGLLHWPAGHRNAQQALAADLTAQLHDLYARSGQPSPDRTAR